MLLLRLRLVVPDVEEHEAAEAEQDAGDEVRHEVDGRAALAAKA